MNRLCFEGLNWPPKGEDFWGSRRFPAQLFALIRGFRPLCSSETILWWSLFYCSGRCEPGRFAVRLRLPCSVPDLTGLFFFRTLTVWEIRSANFSALPPG